MKKALEEAVSKNSKLEKENRVLSNKLYFKNVKALKNMMLDQSLLKSVEKYAPDSKLATKTRYSTQGPSPRDIGNYDLEQRLST